METTTKTALKTLVVIRATGEKHSFSDPKQAVEFLCKNGHLSIDKLTKTPIFALQEAISSGIVDIQFNATQEEADRPSLKMEIKQEQPQVKQLRIEAPAAPEIIKPAPVKQVVKETAPTDKAAQFLALINEMVTPQAAPIDLQQVREIVREELSKQEPTKVIHEIKILDQVKPIGTAHFMVPKVCQLINLKLNVYLFGPSGSGKSHAGQQIAELLDLDFYSLSICSQTTKTDLLGYTGPTGQYIETDFYKAYSNGGLFLLDEVDNGNPNILTLMNSAISNRFCSFPCGQVKQHDNFRIIAGANTIGNGGNIQYVGRNPLDGATKARFKFVEFPIDENLELEISPNKDFCKKVQVLRAKASKLGIKAIITPRDSRDGGTMINHGFTEAEALEYCIFNKLSQDETKLLKA